METHVVCRHKHGKLEYNAEFKTDVFYPSRVVCVDCLQLHLLTQPGADPLPAEVVDCVMTIARRLARA